MEEFVKISNKEKTCKNRDTLPEFLNKTVAMIILDTSEYGIWKLKRFKKKFFLQPDLKNNFSSSDTGNESSCLYQVK